MQYRYIAHTITRALTLDEKIAASVLFALREAITAARAESGVSGYYRLDSPAICERIRMACQDKLTRQVCVHVYGGGVVSFNFTYSGSLSIFNCRCVDPAARDGLLKHNYKKYIRQ